MWISPYNANPKRLGSIQILRGLAASIVVFHHYGRVIGDFDHKPSWLVQSGFTSIGAAGVDLFFLISGFIMVYTTIGKVGREDSLTFIRRRSRRIFPLYWLWTTVLLILCSAGVALKSHRLSVLFVVKSYLLLPASNGRSYHPLLDQGWTLSFEMLFYGVFSVAIWQGVRYAKPLIVLTVFLVLTLLGRWAPPGSGARYLLSNPIIFEFLFGMLGAEFVLRVQKIPQWFRPYLLIVLGVVLLFGNILYHSPDNLRFLFFGIPSFLILVGSAITPQLSSSCLIYLGDASYSIYLTHGFFSMALALAIKRLPFFQFVPADLLLLSMSAFTIFITSLTYKFIEKPLQRLSPVKRLSNVAGEAQPVPTA